MNVKKDDYDVETGNAFGVSMALPFDDGNENPAHPCTKLQSFNAWQAGNVADRKSPSVFNKTSHLLRVSLLKLRRVNGGQVRKTNG
ncbi:MAG: hypothetical protein JW837_08275 [Sedimentisphaerales bacterium]|nr:hypothetical protein [Sedimentisphaerales bacterium]